MKLLVAIVMSLIISSHTQGVLPQSVKSTARQSVGKIKGLILDPNDARIPFATITIESSPKVGFRKKLKPGEAGEFEIELPAGIYYITVEATSFCKFEGWELKVVPRVTEMVNIHMEVASSHGGCHCTLKKS